MTTSRLVRLSLATTAVLALAGLLAGCGQPSRASTSTPTTTESQKPHSSTRTGLGWEAALSSAEGLPQWADSLVADSDWKLSLPDNGQGNWGYTSASTGCVLIFGQSRYPHLGKEAHDRALTQETIATILTAGGHDPSHGEAAVAHPLVFGLRSDESAPEATVDGLLTISGDTVVWARAFVSINAVLYIDARCPDPVNVIDAIDAIHRQTVMLI